MFSLSLHSQHRLGPALRLRLHVAYARAWEALVDTHQTQAVLFVRRLADRLSLESALARYFREVAVPVAMQETVRARALLALADSVPAVPGIPDADPWQRLRPDRLMDSLRRRAQWVEDTRRDSRMAACLADGAVTATHIGMAIEVAELLAGAMPEEEALMVYIRAFDLPAKDADAVFRAGLAELAARQLPTDRRPRLVVESATQELLPPATVASLPGQVFGLRVIV